MSARKNRRGPRIRAEEVERMLSLYREGKTFKAIAREVGRHWQSVRKHTIQALQDREGQELRRDALRVALSHHYQDLVGALGSLPGLLDMPRMEYRGPITPWQPATPQRRDRLLLAALRECHARESPLWAWWESWKEARVSCQNAQLPLLEHIDGEMASLGASPGVSLTAALREILVNKGLMVAQGHMAAYDTGLYEVRPAAGGAGPAGPEELWSGPGQSVLLARGQNLDRLKQELPDLMASMTGWAEIEELARLYGQLNDLKAKIEEETEVLALKRAYPGHCRLCPV